MRLWKNVYFVLDIIFSSNYASCLQNFPDSIICHKMPELQCVINVVELYRPHSARIYSTKLSIYGTDQRSHLNKGHSVETYSHKAALKLNVQFALALYLPTHINFRNYYDAHTCVQFLDAVCFYDYIYFVYMQRNSL